MNILLVHPYWPYPYSRGEFTYNRIWPPLCLANCAALLEREGHKVRILDAHAQRIKPDRLARNIEGYNKIFITSSTLDKWQCPNIDITPFLQTVLKIRELTDEVYCMGYHCTIAPERLLFETKAKAVIRGEYEHTVSNICKNIELSRINGLTFNRDGKIISTPECEPMNLSNLPIPAFHLLNFKKYFYEIIGGDFALFEISRGCAFNCIFCNKIMYGQSVRSKRKEQICTELGEAIENHGVRHGYFMDLDFFANRNISEEACDFLIARKYKFKWACQTRTDFLDKQILAKMKQAGCEIIHLGVESGIQKSLDYMRKNISVEKVEKAVRMIQEAKIKILAFLIFGIPNETNEDRKKSVSFIKLLNPEFVSFKGFIDYGFWGHSLGNKISDKELNKFLKKSLRSYYFRITYLFKLKLSLIWGCLRLFTGRIITLR
jgi:radical SAM superfamily enzyme YgiQ (UPF0313 family)